MTEWIDPFAMKAPPKSYGDLSHIRMAGVEDEMQVFNLCGLMHAEVAMHPISWPRVSAMIRLATRRERGIVGVIGEPNDLKAAIFMVIEPIWYSDDWHLLEYFTFVRSDARRSHYARDLLYYGMKCADDLSLVFTCGVYSGVKTKAKCRMYGQIMPRVGEFYRYTPASRQAAMLAGAQPANQVAAE